MNEIIRKALSRGAPIDTPVRIDIYEFLELFDNTELYKEYKISSREVICMISNIIGMYGGDFVLPTEAIISMNSNGSKVMQFSAENYIFSLMCLLTGVEDDAFFAILEDKEKFQILKEKVINIKNSEELKLKLPRIYELYINQLKVNQTLLELEKIQNDRTIPLDARLKEISKITNNFKEFYSEFDLKEEQQFAKDFTLTLYLKRMMGAVEHMLDHAEEVIGIYDRHTLDLNQFTEEDEDRLNLYIAVQFMKKIEHENEKNKQRYLFYLTNYFKENVETQVTRVKIKLYGKKVTPISLYQKYKELLVTNPNLLAVNFSYNDFREMTKEEVEEFIIAYLAELAANWEFMPSDDTTVEKKVTASAKRAVKHLSLEEKKQKEEKLMNLYMRKKKFYDETDPYFRIKGKQTFDGYVGYIYANSLVVLEKFYDNADTAKIADNNAIYIVSMSDFYELSQHSKTYLMTSPLCKRVTHKGVWEERVLEYINRKNGIESPNYATNQLIEDIFLIFRKNGFKNFKNLCI